jgi:excisionase family DNA binding protein
MGNATLTVRETAVLLGTDLSYTYHLIHAGRLPATKVDGKWAVDKDAAFALAHRRKARQQKTALREERRAQRREERAAEDARWRERLASVR